MGDVKMELKSIDVGSIAKIAGIVYAALGLVFGGLFSLFAMVGAAGAAGSASADVPMGSFLFGGMAAVIVLPIFYGVVGALGAAVMALIYNLAARTVGGIRVELS